MLTFITTCRYLAVIFKCFERTRVSECLINSILLRSLNSIPFRLHFSPSATFIAPIVYTFCEFPLRFVKQRRAAHRSKDVGWLAGWLAGWRTLLHTRMLLLLRKNPFRELTRRRLRQAEGGGEGRDAPNCAKALNIRSTKDSLRNRKLI